MQADERPKLIYFAERPPHFDRARFIGRWRQHAKLGMSMPRWRNVERYAHCDSVEEATVLPVAWCDGVATVRFRSEENRVAHVTDASAGPAMKRDEQEAFARPVREVAVLTEEFRFREEEPAPRKLFLRVWAKPEATPEEFRRWWLEEHGPAVAERLDARSTGRGYSQNHARGEESGRGVPPPVCDVVDEIATADPGAVAQIVQDILDAAPEARSLLDKVRAIWTEETVLHGR